MRTQWTSSLEKLDQMGKKIVIVIDGLNTVEIPSKITRVSYKLLICKYYYKCNILLLLSAKQSSTYCFKSAIKFTKSAIGLFKYYELQPLFWLPKIFPTSTKVIMSTQAQDVTTIKELIEERNVAHLKVTVLDLDLRISLCEVIF